MSEFIGIFIRFYKIIVVIYIMDSFLLRVFSLMYIDDDIHV